jgi:manganese transport protein
MAPPPAASLAFATGDVPDTCGGAAPIRPAAFWRRLIAFGGPGFLVAVGYMDPGNWATDIAGGSRFGYLLLSVIIASNLMAMVLQSLSARLGIVTGLDLAEACRAHYSRRTTILLWLLCETAIIACELAEVIGTAIALQLLFGLPLPLGVLASLATLPIVTVFERKGAGRLELYIIALMTIVATCLGVEVILAQPEWGSVLTGMIPDAATTRDPGAIYLAAGILGATVMPHNLYLHSSLTKAKASSAEPAAKRDAIRLSSVDSAIALTLAMFVNAAILVVAAATFHAGGRTDVVDIGHAYRLLEPMLGVGVASLLFGVALLASGQNATITGALAGQVVMEGFLGLRLSPAKRRLLTRGIAVIPAAAVTIGWGQDGTTHLLILSQVVLSLQLPFAIVPLIHFTADRRRMGALAAPLWLTGAACASAAIIIMLNAVLLMGLA